MLSWAINYLVNKLTAETQKPSCTTETQRTQGEEIEQILVAGASEANNSGLRALCASVVDCPYLAARHKGGNIFRLRSGWDLAARRKNKSTSGGKQLPQPERLFENVLGLRGFEIQRFYIAIEAKPRSDSQHIIGIDTVVEVKDVCARLSKKRKSGAKRPGDMDPAR